MQNSKTNSANSASQPTLPGVRDWTQPITARGSELAAIIAEAQAQGFLCHRMKVLPEVIYELQFFRLAGTAEAECPPEISKESFSRPTTTRRTATPASLCNPTEN